MIYFIRKDTEKMDIISMYPEYLRHFTRDDYSAAFEKYKAECKPFFAHLSGDNMDFEISRLMDFAAIELRRKIGRKAKCFDLRSFLCVYLCPAALDYGTEEARDFASALAEKWNKSYPEYSFEVGFFQDIASGFRTKPFSF